MKKMPSFFTEEYKVKRPRNAVENTLQPQQAEPLYSPPPPIDEWYHIIHWCKPVGKAIYFTGENCDCNQSVCTKCYECGKCRGCNIREILLLKELFTNKTEDLEEVSAEIGAETGIGFITKESLEMYFKNYFQHFECKLCKAASLVIKDVNDVVCEGCQFFCLNVLCNNIEWFEGCIKNEIYDLSKHRSKFFEVTNINIHEYILGFVDDMKYSISNHSEFLDILEYVERCKKYEEKKKDEWRRGF